jgi:protein-histidine pros-kinase
MKLLMKFNLISLALAAVALAIVSWIAHDFLLQNARNEVLQQAKLMMESATATRNYTTEELKPLIVTSPLNERQFLPQIVPAFGALSTFNRLRRKFPDYFYKEATLNPTNLRDRAVDWEADVIEDFRNQPDLKEFVGERDTPTGASLYLAHPIVTDDTCMECHSIPSVAPKSMVEKYGSVNGFGWKVGETVGAQIVSVPMAVPVHIANQGFRKLIGSLVATFVAILIVVNVALYLLIVRPVRRLSAVADRVSLGQLENAELPVRGKDEIAQLTAAFNRLVVTVAKALRMLD